MSRVYRPASPGHIFQSRAEIEEHLLSKISGNTGGRIGTELELFVTTPEGLPITFDQVEMVLERISATFPGTKSITEKDRIVALDIPDVGNVCLEPGGQIELSTCPCETLAELETANRTLRHALDEAAAFFGLKVEGRGHMKSFLAADMMPRSRFSAYGEYLKGALGKKAGDLLDTMKSCCGLQINLDPMGAECHEIYRALLLADVATSLAQRTERSKRLYDTYTKQVPEQMMPVFTALSATSNEGVVEHIASRLLTLKVPFIPDHRSEEGFCSTSSVFGHTPTVGELLQSKNLTTDILDNALSLQLSMPNLRRHGVLETRAPDSVNSLEELMGIAKTYHRLAYDATARQALLESFKSIDPLLLERAFLARFDAGDISGFDLGGGKKVADLVRHVHTGSEEPIRQATKHTHTASLHLKKQKKEFFKRG